MHLPQQIAETYSIVNSRDSVSVGDCLYYAPDGTIQRVTDSSRLSLELYEETSDTYWKVSKNDIEENLYADFFPVKATV
jgi:hypothetical protein